MNILVSKILCGGSSCDNMVVSAIAAGTDRGMGLGVDHPIQVL